MDDETISKLAYSGQPPESALPHEWLLWYRLRDIYADTRAGRMTAEQGRAAKRAAVNAFRTEREAWERNILFWKRIEAAAIAYAKSGERTAAGDDLYESVYRLRPSRHHENDISTEKGKTK